MIQETIEEAAEKCRQFYLQNNMTINQIFEAGAKWKQERMYSEEDMREAFKSSSLTNMLNVYDSFEEFIEQFKKK